MCPLAACLLAGPAKTRQGVFRRRIESRRAVPERPERGFPIKRSNFTRAHTLGASVTDVLWRCMHRAVPERPEASPLALLRVPMRMICSVYAYAIIKGRFLVKKLG